MMPYCPASERLDGVSELLYISLSDSGICEKIFKGESQTNWLEVGPSQGHKLR